MSLEPFQKSDALSLGVELELQLVNTHDYDLAPYAESMLRLMGKIPLPGSVVPEMTSSMIEVSTGVCQSSSEVLGQLSQIRDALVKSADKLNIAVVGGGTHPFQQWHERRIYDKPRFRELSELYGYLSKQFTIFGQHMPLREHILLTMAQVHRHATSVGASASIQLLRDSVERNNNDARWLREKQNDERLLAEVIRQAGERFRGGASHLPA